jgi:hypothetical protein
MKTHIHKKICGNENVYDAGYLAGRAEIAIFKGIAGDAFVKAKVNIPLRCCLRTKGAKR